MLVYLYIHRTKKKKKEEEEEEKEDNTLRIVYRKSE